MLVDGERDHLRDGREARDGTVVGRVLSVAALVDEDRPPLEEPVVLIVPPVRRLPFDHLLFQQEDRFLDLWSLLDRE